MDTFRGLAAVAVVWHHMIGGEMGVRSARVMAFFVISGYCIAASAESCLRKGIGARGFLLRRAWRIWPTYLLSLLYLVVMSACGATTGGWARVDRPLWVWLKNITLTQWTGQIHHPRPNAGSGKEWLVGVHWSLGYEVQFYAAVAIFMVIAAATRARLGVCFAFSIVAGLAWEITHPTLCYGWLGDYWVHFAIGAVVFYRLTRMPSAAARRGIDAGLAMLLGACVYVRWFAGIDWNPGRLVYYRVVYEQLAVAAGFGVALIALRPLSERWDRWGWTRPLRWLGAISYSLFLVHDINRGLAANLAGRMLPGGAPAWLDHGVQLVLHIALATAFWYLCERPFSRGSKHVAVSHAPAQLTVEDWPIPPRPSTEGEGEGLSPA